MTHDFAPGYIVWYDTADLNFGIEDESSCIPIQSKEEPRAGPQSLACRRSPKYRDNFGMHG